MKATNDLDQLIRFLERDEDWAEAFGETMSQHLTPAMDTLGLEDTTLADLVGDHWMGILFGCALEDFLSAEFEPDDSNPADDYLKRRGWTETSSSRAYIRAIRHSVMSLYEVSEITPGKSFLARDLIRGGEPVSVSERMATQSLKPWDKLAARLVPVGRTVVMTGGMLPFSNEAADRLLGVLSKSRGRRKTRRGGPLASEETAMPSAHIFTAAWLMDVIPRARGERQPIVRNADGDDILFHDARFPLAKGVKVKDVAAALARIDALRAENERFWNWVGPASPGAPLKSASTHGVSLHALNHDGEVVLGSITLKSRVLSLSTNSAARAARGAALLKDVLGDLIGPPTTRVRTIEQLRAEPRDAATAPSAAIPNEVATPVIHELMDRQYRAVLDQAVPALGDVTPRQAVRSAKGRATVASWLKDMENHAGRGPDPTDPMATYDFRWMWRELGIEDLRK